MTTIFAGTFEVGLDGAGHYTVTFTSGRGVVGTMRVGPTLVSQILGLGTARSRFRRRRRTARVAVLAAPTAKGLP
jgi:hypothetical protein